jgi:hypothetical protein
MALDIDATHSWCLGAEVGVLGGIMVMACNGWEDEPALG